MLKISKSIFLFFGIIFFLVVSFFIGFLFCAIIFVFAGEGNSHWGDCATWVGSVAAVAAFIAAVWAVYLNKKSSDQALQNSAFMELSSLASIKSSDANRHFKDMLNDIEEEKRNRSIGLAFDKTGKLEEMAYQLYQDKILACSEQIKKIFAHTIKMVDVSELDEKKKNLIVEGFIDSFSEELINEIISGKETVFFWGNSSSYRMYRGLYLQNYEMIMNEIRRLNMYSSHVEAADRARYGDSSTPV